MSNSQDCRLPIAIVAVVAIATWIPATACEPEPLPIPTQSDVVDYLRGPCVSDEDCEWFEVCHGTDMVERDCYVPCEVTADCPAGRCGELVGDLSGQGVCL